MSGDEGDKAMGGGGGGGGGGEYGTFQGPPSYPPPRPPVVGYPQPVQPPGLVGQRYSRNRGGSRYRSRCTWTWLRSPSLLWVGHWLGSIHTWFYLWCHSLVCWSTSAVFLQKGSQGETRIYCMCSSGCHRYNSHHHRGSCTL